MTVTLVGITILIISILGAILLVKRSDPDTQRQSRILLFGLYFWVIAFLQLILASILYSVLTG